MKFLGFLLFIAICFLAIVWFIPTSPQTQAAAPAEPSLREKYQAALLQCGVPANQASALVDEAMKNLLVVGRPETDHRMGKVCLHYMGDPRSLSDNSW